MPDEMSGSVSVPRWQIHFLGGLVVILVAAWIARGAANQEVVADLRDRVVTLETIHGLRSPDGGR